MPNKGPNVGAGYVKLAIDGSTLNDDIEDAVEGVDTDKAGDKAGKDYGEAMSESLRKELSETMDRLGKKLSANLSRNLNANLKKTFSDSSANGIGTRMGSIIGAAVAEQIADHLGVILLDLDDKVKSVSGNGGSGGGGGGGRGGGTTGGSLDPDDSGRSPQTIAFVKKFLAAKVKLIEDANDSILKSDKALLKDQQALMDELLKSVRGNADFLASFDLARTKLREESNANILKLDQKLIEDQEKLMASLRKEAVKEDAKMWKWRNDIARLNAKVQREIEQGILDERGNTIRKLAKGNRVGDLVGRSLGAGSRNNALNLFGKSIGGIVNLTDTAARGAGRMFTAFQTGFNSAAEGASFFQKSLSGLQNVSGTLSSGFGALIKSGPAVVAAVLAVVSALVVLTSVVSALTAALVALVATVAGAAVGALGVLGASMGALLVTGGLLTATFTSLGTVQKKALKEAFIPVRDVFAQIGQIMAKPLFAGENSPVERWGKNVRKALLLLVPVAKVMGDAFATAGTILTKSLSGPGFQRFADSLSKFLPSITVNLSNALGQFLNGVAGLFAALMPYVERFSKYLSDVATRFSKFVNSADGQNKIKGFFDRAVESAKVFFGFLDAVGDVLGKLLFSPEAMKAGNSIFTDMTNGLRNFLAYLSEDNRLERWFADGKRFAEALGSAIRIAGIALENLSSSGVVSGLANILGAVEKIATAFNNLPRPIKAVIAPILDVSGAFKALALAAGYAIGFVLDSIAFLLRGFAKLMGAASKIPIFGSLFKGNAKAIREAANEVSDFADKVRSIPTSWNTVITADTSPAMSAFAKYSQYVRSLNLPGLGGFGSVINKYGGVGDQQYGPPKNLAPTPAPPKLPSIPKGAFGGGGGGGGSKDKGPTPAEIAKALREVLRDVKDAMAEIVKATSVKEVRDNLKTLVRSMESAGEGLNKVARKRLRATAALLRAQGQVDVRDVQKLVDGERVKNATLTELAAARGRVIAKLEAAKTKLADALALRDDYAKSVADAVRSFGALTTATAKTVDGVEQALTSKDITDNLQERLAKIKQFQTNLRILLSQGLSQNAYKQIIDQGVDAGSVFADALVAGGPGAIGNLNSLTGQIDKIANSLGVETSNRLYQAGVDAAQGLVDGLTSLSKQLDSAAVKLGESIARAVKRALGIKSPSRVMIDAMGSVGDGIEQGLDGQHNKVVGASSRLSSAILISPEAAAVAGKTATVVSGNEGPKLLWTGDVVTATEDPGAVMHEVLNEVVGRL